MKYDKDIEQVVKVYEYGLDEWSDGRDKGLENYKYMLNDQWTSAEKEYLAKDGRPAIVYNMLVPRIHNLLGTEQLNRRSVRIRPRSGKYIQTASVVNDLWKSIVEKEEVEYKLQRVFLDGLIMPIPSWMEIAIELNNEGFPEYKFQAANPFNIVADPDFKNYDLSDCKYIIKEKWMTLDDIKDIYGKKEEYDKESKLDWWEELTERIGTFFGSTTYDSRYYDKNNNTYKILEMQERITEIKAVMFEPMSQSYFTIEPHQVKETLEKTKGMVQFINEIRKPVIHIKTIVPYFNVVVFDENNQYQSDMYDVIPYLSFDYNHKKSETNSLIEALKDIQKNMNKRQIQKTNYLDHAINAPVLFTDQDKEAKEEFERMGNKPGMGLLYRNPKAPPQRMPPGNVPGDIWGDIQDSENKLNDISAVNDTMRGESQYSTESGRLFAMKAERAGVTVNPYFNNLTKTRKMLGEYFLSTVKQVYGQENRPILLTDKNAGIDKEEVLNMEIYGQVFNNITDFEGVVMLDEAEYSPTKMAESFQQKMVFYQLLGGQPELINWKWFFKDSELTDAEEQVEHMQNVLGQSAEAQAQQQAMQEQQQILQQLQMEKDLTTAEPESKETPAGQKAQKTTGII